MNRQWPCSTLRNGGKLMSTKVLKVASQADVWYNGVLNSGVVAMLETSHNRTHLLRRRIMDTVSHPAENGNPYYVYTLAYPDDYPDSAKAGTVFYVGKGKRYG